MARVEELKKLSILDVAEALGLELKRQGTDRYVWVEHESFVISPRRNRFSWFSRDLRGGDALELVQTIREEQTGTRPSFKTAKHFLEVGEFPEVDMTAAPAPKLAFEYRHERYEHTNPSWTKDYLRRERKLSEETITFFFQQGSIAEISHKMNDYSEPAIVFKFKNSQGKVMGASLQGIVENREKYPDRGYLKRILKNSDGLTGFYADVGRPKRLIFAESPIDVMSYYQLHPQLQDVRLVAMDGLKEGLMSFRFAELVSELQGKTYEPGERTARVLEATAKTSTFFQSNEDFITLAVDNDSAGWNFISKLQEKGIPFKLDIPPIAEKGVEKADWNSFLKEPLKGQAELVHIYSYDKKKKAAAYQGYFSKELATAKVAQLTAGDVVAFSTSETLSQDEIEKLAANQSQTYHQLSEAKERMEGKTMAELFTDEQNEIQIEMEEYQKVQDEEFESLKRRNEAWKRDRRSEAIGKADSKITVELSYLKDYETREFANFEEYKQSVLQILDLTGADVYLPENLTPKEFMITIANETTLLPFKIDGYRIEYSSDLIKLLADDGTLKQNYPLSVEEWEDQASWREEEIIEDRYSNPFDYHEPGYSLTWDDGFLDNEKLHQAQVKKEELELDGDVKSNQEEISYGSNPLDVQQSKNENLSLTGQKKKAAAYQGYFSKELATAKVAQLTAGDVVAFSTSETLSRDEIEEFATNQSKTYPQLSEAKESTKQEARMEEKTLAEIFSDEQKEHIREFFKTRISDVQTDYIFLNSGQEDLGYFLDGYLFANHYAELYPLSPDKQVDILMSRLISDDGREFDEIELGFTINRIDKDFLQNKFGYNPDTPIEEYRQSEKNIDRIQAKEEEDFLQSIDQEDFNKVLELVKENDAWTVFQLQTDEELGVNTSQVYDFIERYLDPNHDLDYGFDNQFFSNLKTEDLLKKAEEKGLYLHPERKPTIGQLIQDRDLKGLSAHMKEGVKNYFNSDTYKAFLNTMSKLNNYSLNNLFLIVAQNPKASAVASFKAWKSFDRHVKKGEKALKIWAPYQVTRKDEKGKPVLNKKGQEVKDTRFRLVPVFDVSQTEGKELPQPVYELEGTHQDYANLYRAAKETAAAKGIAFEISKEPMEAHGYYSPTENKIVIRAGMSERETLSTIFHEMAHADLHNPKALEGQKLTRTNKELQAESVAYVVANHYGLDTSSYSFGYLANWSKEPDSLADLEAQLSIVQKEAADLIHRLDTAFEKYQNKEVSKDPLSQKLVEFNEKCHQKMAEKAASEPEKKSHPQKGDEEKDNQASK